MSNNILIVIPARMKATRFPNKPLAPIMGKPMILHCLERAKEANLGPVLVAAAETEVMDTIKKAGGEVVMTDPDLPSGSDRVLEAVKKYDPKRNFDIIVNMQGDLPTLAPKALRQCVDVFDHHPETDISTLAAVITREEEKNDPNVVKAIAALTAHSEDTPKNSMARALYFTRSTAPSGEGDLFHHIGLYGFRRSSLERFVSLPPSILEKREKLEQLRALEAGMVITVHLTDTVPHGVDVFEDIKRAEEILSQKS